MMPFEVSTGAGVKVLSPSPSYLPTLFLSLAIYAFFCRYFPSTLFLAQFFIIPPPPSLPPPTPVFNNNNRTTLKCCFFGTYKSFSTPLTPSPHPPTFFFNHICFDNRTTVKCCFFGTYKLFSTPIATFAP